MNGKSKMKKKLVSLLMVLALLVTMVPAAAFAQGDGSAKNPVVVYRNPSVDKAGETMLSSYSFDVRSTTIDEWISEIAKSQGINVNSIEDVRYYIGTTDRYSSFDDNYLLWKPYSYWFGWNTAKPTEDRSSTETEKVKLYDASGNVMHTAEYLNVKVKNYVTVSWSVDDTNYSSKIVLNSALATTEYDNAAAAISEKVNKNDGKEWEFKGWDTDGDNTTIEISSTDAEAYFAKVVDVTDADGCIAAKSVDGAVFKAVFKKKDYTVTWVDEDGTVLETDENVEYGETPEFNGKKPSKGDGEKVEYEFLGWSPATSPVTGDVTYKATYKEVDKKAYTVKFIYGDNNVSTTSVVEGNTVEKPADPVQDGYEFDGWYTDENYTTEFNFANTEINKDTDIYAKWLEVYTISFDANAEGVEGTMAPMYITEGVENTALTANAYKLPGYEFKGWTPEQGGDVVVYENEASITPDGNMTLYAVWEKIPAVDTEIVVEKTDVTVTYGAFTMDDIIVAAAPKVMAGEDEVAGAAVTTADDITNNNVGTYQVKLDYAGTVNARAATEYNASSTTINVTIVPAKAEVVVKSNAVKYGTVVEPPIKANCKTIDVIVGMDIHDETNLVGIAQAALPTELLFGLGALANKEDINLNDMSIEDLETLLKKAEGIDDKLDLGIAKIKEYEDSIRELIDTLKAVQAELPMDTELKISVVPETLVIPKNIGLYLVASILADDNYVAESADGSNANMDAGYLIIAPNGIKTDLTWNDTDDNDIITLDKKAKFDFEATAKIDESTLDGVKGYDNKGAQSHVEYLFVGVDGEGLVVDRCTDPNGAADALTVGAYAQVAYVANWDNIMYYGMPIARPVVVAPNVADVAIIDANGNENYAQAYTYGDDIGLAVTVDGKKAPVEGLTVKYIGSDTTVDGWYRDELPTDAGVYTVVATYTENDENGNLYKAGGAVGVLIINPADAEIGLEDAKYEYDGNEYFATITNDKFDYATVAIDRANNIAYVNLPEDTQAHVERLVAMLPADAEKAVNDQLAKYEGFDGDVQTSTLKKEMNDMLQAIIDADMTAAAKAEAKALMEALVEEFENNEDVKALAAKIESELKALKDKIGEEIPDDIEAEITQYIKDAVTVNEDGTVEIDADKLEADLDKMISEMEGKLPASVVAELKEMKKEIVKAVENNIDIEAIEKEISDITTKIEGLDKEDIAKIAIAAAYEAYGSLDKEQIKELAKEAIYKIEAQGYIDYAEGMLESIKNMYGGDIDTTDLEAAIKDLIDDSEAAIKAGDIDADSLKSLENHIDKILAEMQGVIDQIPDGTIVFGKNPSEVGEYDCYAINISANYKAELVDAKLVIYEKEQTEDPKDPTNPTDPTDPTTPDQPKDDEIDTGDHSNMALPLVLATAALAAIVALFATRRRHS